MPEASRTGNATVLSSPSRQPARQAAACAAPSIRTIPSFHACVKYSCCMHSGFPRHLQEWINFHFSLFFLAFCRDLYSFCSADTPTHARDVGPHARSMRSRPRHARPLLLDGAARGDDGRNRRRRARGHCGGGGVPFSAELPRIPEGIIPTSTR